MNMVLVGVYFRNEARVVFFKERFCDFQKALFKSTVNNRIPVFCDYN